MANRELQQVPEGYRQTEVGIFPDTWEVSIIDNIVARAWLDKPMDGNHGNIHPKSADFVDYGIPFVMANNVQRGYVDLNGCSFLRKEQADSLQKGFAKSGDVLLTHKATIGNTAVVEEIPSDYIMLTPQVTYYRVLDDEKIYNLYLRHYMDGPVFQSILESLSGGGTRSYIGITAQRQLPLVVPPIEEQIAIANALSDVDALITSLEKLIAKKRAIKTAAMQQLLTGKKRLPPFCAGRHLSGAAMDGEEPIDTLNLKDGKAVYKQTELGEIPEDWEVVCVHEIGRFQSGNGFPTKYQGSDFGKYPFFKVSDMNNYGNEKYLVTANNYIDESVRQVINPAIIPKNAIVFAKIGAAVFLERKRMTVDFSCIDNNLMAFLPDAERVTLDYAYYVFMSMRLSAHVEATALPSLGAGDIGAIRIPICSIDEQLAISKALSDMDCEIDSLEQKLTKTQHLKQGMMQELLTGRTRLV